MHSGAASTTSNSGTKPDVRACVDELQAALGQAGRGYGDVFDSLTAGLDRLVAENTGMADELIGAYEQLGIVFKVTRQLPEIQDERQMLMMFVDSLRSSFPDRELRIVRRHGDEWRFAGNNRPILSGLETVFARAADRRSAIIESQPSDLLPRNLAEAMIGPIYSGDAFVCALVFQRDRSAPEFRAVEMLLLDSLTTFCGDLIRSQRLFLELRRMAVAIVQSLVNAVDQKDEYTSGHSLRVAFYADLLAREVGLSAGELQMLQWSALLHDVGKIGIRDDVLKKEGKLTDEEFEHIREHPVRSYQIVQGIPQLANALDGILYHHERYDGSGYPVGLVGDAIPYHARIIQIADVFDALTSNRSYRRAYDWEKALNIMAGDAGRAVDPDLEARFEVLIRRELDGSRGGWEELTERANLFTPAVTGELIGEEGQGA